MSKQRPLPSPDDVLRRMLSTPPIPHVAKKPKLKKRKKVVK